MAVHEFSADEEWNAGIEARSSGGYRTLAYDGDLGGGTLQVLTQMEGGAKVPVANGKLAAATVDANGDVAQQLVFQSSGNVWVHLTGATAPTAVVTVG